MTKDEIKRNAPEGATHYLDGIYYKENHYGVWFIWDAEWLSSFRFPDDNPIRL